VFTGIVEELGVVVRRDEGRLSVRAPLVATDAAPGGSIAVNGCCLTVVEVDGAVWSADVVEETFHRTNLGDLRPSDRVNLERPLRVGDRVAGHLVQGHVDATGLVEAPAPDLRISAPPHLLRYVVEKGSITVDGCSLTVVEVRPEGFSVAVIPHTAGVTTLGLRKVGDRVNVEVDMIAKYTERLLPGPSGDQA
jgi:riboflavin synthase